MELQLLLLGQSVIEANGCVEAEASIGKSAIDVPLPHVSARSRCMLSMRCQHTSAHAYTMLIMKLVALTTILASQRPVLRSQEIISSANERLSDVWHLMRDELIFRTGCAEWQRADYISQLK
jgi:hypothetical protein